MVYSPAPELNTQFMLCTLFAVRLTELEMFYFLWFNEKLYSLSSNRQVWLWEAWYCGEICLASCCFLDEKVSLLVCHLTEFVHHLYVFLAERPHHLVLFWWNLVFAGLFIGRSFFFIWNDFFRSSFNAGLYVNLSLYLKRLVGDFGYHQSFLQCLSFQVSSQNPFLLFFNSPARLLIRGLYFYFAPFTNSTSSLVCSPPYFSILRTFPSLVLVCHSWCCGVLLYIRAQWNNFGNFP